MSKLPVLAAGAVAVLAFGSVPQDPIDIEEWQVPWAQSRPRDPSVGPDGRVWFVGQVAHYVAAFDPASETFKRYDLDEGTGPHNLIVADDGTVWYAGNRAQHIGRLDPATGAIRKVPTPDPVRDPHTLVFNGRGDIWFTAQTSNYVGRLTLATEAVRVVAVPAPRARPYGIWLTAGGTPWVALFGTNKLATVDPLTMTLSEVALPQPDARPRRLVITPDQMVWYGDYARGYLGRYDPASGAFAEWQLPGGPSSLPYAMTLDDRGRIWIVETGVRPNRFVGFDPATETFLGITPIGSGAGSVRHMVFDRRTRAIWFGTDANTIGRARIP
ncbi:MAG TPA: hypothetical protein VGA37_11725 [Gemmatimonadales bacterium]